MFTRLWQDRPLRNAMLVAFVLRLVPMLVWIEKPCVRDECTYIDLANKLLAGDGMVGTHGWLWAPAYPALMAVHRLLFGYPGTVQITQLLVAVASVAMVHSLTKEEYGERPARFAAWAYALNPTMIFYTTSLWSETLYSGVLLAAVLALRHARVVGTVRAALLPGMLVGVCVLFRGVATYMLPCFLVGLAWGRGPLRANVKALAACALAAVLTVAPYSAYASHKFGEFVVADRTMGQMMWLGNNDFPPMTFDWGNGALSDRAFERATRIGRPACDRTGNPIEKDDCDTANGIDWIRAHPGEFLRRIPLRVAQLVNPHSFLTRNLRWGRWRGLPPIVDEGLIVAVVAFSYLTLVGGTLGLVARAKGWYAVTSGLVVLYHVAAIAALAGLTRYRVPLEPLWLVHAAAFVDDPRGALRVLADGSARSVLGVGLVVFLLLLMAWFLPAGWPAWHTW